MAVAVARGALPVAVAVDVGLERAEQLAGVALVGVLDRPEDALAIEAQRLAVLDGEQQREGAEVAVRGDLGRGAVGERGRLQRAARLVEGVADPLGRQRAAGRGAGRAVDLLQRQRAPGSPARRDLPWRRRRRRRAARAGRPDGAPPGRPGSGSPGARRGSARPPARRRARRRARRPARRSRRARAGRGCRRAPAVPRASPRGPRRRGGARSPWRRAPASAPARRRSPPAARRAARSPRARRSAAPPRARPPPRRLGARPDGRGPGREDRAGWARRGRRRCPAGLHLGANRVEQVLGQAAARRWPGPLRARRGRPSFPRSRRRSRCATSSRPPPCRTSRSRRSLTAIPRESTSYCSLTSRLKAASVIAMNGVS